MKYILLTCTLAFLSLSILSHVSHAAYQNGRADVVKWETGPKPTRPPQVDTVVILGDE